MPTRHPRIALVEDPELARALDLAEPLLDDRDRRSRAARIRALAIRGSRALAAEHGDDRARQEAALDDLGASRTTTRLEQLGPPIALGPPHERAGSAALDDVRGAR